VFAYLIFSERYVMWVDSRLLAESV